MKWTQEADAALSRVPFLVRRRVRKCVEEEAGRSGAHEVRLEHVRACQRRFLERMEDEVRGFQVETCFGPSGCPNRVVMCDALPQELEDLLARRRLKALLKERVKGPLKIHHEFRMSISDCPNACSRPQIVDVGLIGACRPEVSPDEPCSQCGACVETCREGAISLNGPRPRLDERQCVSCGQCLRVCPTGTLQKGEKGYRVLVGGKLGRHPRLGLELPGIHGEGEVLEVIERCLDYYQEHCLEGERLGEILERTGMGPLRASILAAED